MKKSCFAVLMILICLSATLTGCSSSVAVPKDELKRKALDALKDEYSYANSFEFERDIYDESMRFAAAKFVFGKASGIRRFRSARRADRGGPVPAVGAHAK